MGIYDRDYARASTGRRGPLLGGSHSVVKLLLIGNIVVYVLQLITANANPSITTLLNLNVGSLTDSFQVWRLVTYAFCHDLESPMHILFNMLVLWFFGNELERMYGSREFAWFYLTAAAISGLAFVAMEFWRPSGLPAVGASGSLMAVMMLYAIHFPRRVIYILGIVPVEIWLLVLIYVVFDLHPILLNLGGVRQEDRVAHAAHLGGLAFGYLYHAFNLRITRFADGWSLPSFKARKPRIFRDQPDLRVYREEPDPPRPTDAVDRRVDELLEKISKQGEASLTEEERRILFEASRRYRDRRR